MLNNGGMAGLIWLNACDAQQKGRTQQSGASYLEGCRHSQSDMLTNGGMAGLIWLNACDAQQKGGTQQSGASYLEGCWNSQSDMLNNGGMAGQIWPNACDAQQKGRTQQSGASCNANYELTFYFPQCITEPLNVENICPRRGLCKLLYFCGCGKLELAKNFYPLINSVDLVS